MERLSNGEGQVTLCPRADILHYSHDGNVLSVKHHIVCVIDTPCCVTNPRVEIPIVVQPAVQQLGASPGPIFGAPVPAQASAAAMPPGGDWNPILAESVDVPSAVIVGGVATVLQDGKPSFSASQFEEAKVVMPSAPPSGTFDELQNQLRSSHFSLQMIEQFVTDPANQSGMAQLDPDTFGAIVGLVKSSFEQPRAAEILAKHVPTGITCQHVAVALRYVATSTHKADLIRLCAPLCYDLGQNRGVILQELSDFEKMICKVASD